MLLLLNGVSAGKRDQIDKKFFFEITNILDQMIKSTSILLRNFFLKKNSIWSLFPALTPYLLIYFITQRKYLCFVISEISFRFFNFFSSLGLFRFFIFLV